MAGVETVRGPIGTPARALAARGMLDNSRRYFEVTK